MLNMIPIRFYIYAAIAALIGYLVWREHSLTRKLATVRVELGQANANLLAEREARAHEQRIAKDATDDYERRLKKLDDDKTSTPVRSVRLCRSPTGYVPAPTPAASGTGPTDPAGLPQAPGFSSGYGNSDRWGDAGPDIGPSLYALADEADRAAAQCNSLQKWVKAR